MGQLHGKGGSVTWGGTGTVGGEVTNWTLDYTAETAESTNMTTTHKTFLAGHKDWTATVTVKWESTDTDFLTAVGTGPSTLTLFMVAGAANIEMASGALCTGASLATDMGEVIGVVFTFVPGADVAPTFGAS